MVYDSIANASIPTAASNAKDFAKKKRVNRTAKLKQSKLDVRREQWLSQVKNKGFKEEMNVNRAMKMPVSNSNSHSTLKLEINVGGEENEGLMNHCNHYSDSESPSNSPTSHTSRGSGSNTSVTNFSGSSGRSSSGSSSSSGDCCSGSLTDEDEDEDECLDDWEAIADALAADDLQNANLEAEGSVGSGSIIAPEPEPVLTGQEGAPPASFRAWRPDDASRPLTLPNLLKQNSFPMKSGAHYVGFVPSSCPICCEDLDLTDSSFMPCPCGYRLCLFCHKRILEDNGKCPGCRKQYDQPEPDQAAAPSKLARSYSMNPRH